MFKRILVPVDGSNTSNLALQWAVKLAKEQQAQIEVVYVIDDINLGQETGYTPDELVDALRKSGQEILRRAEALLREAGMTAATKLLEIETFGHHVADMIADEAKIWSADVIVIGTHGRRGVTHFFLGSVAERVVRIATTPVLLIRGK